MWRFCKFALISGVVGIMDGAAAFQPNDRAVGDPALSYGSIEFSPDFKYMVWGEYSADGSDHMTMWHCEVDRDTGELIPWDGKGFRAFESTDWGRANTPGQDAQGVYYAGLNQEGQIVLVRPTGAESGIREVLPTPIDFSRRAFYGIDLPMETNGLGMIFWISNREGIQAGPGDPRVSQVQLRYLLLANPEVEATLQDQARPPGTGGFAPLDAVFPRNIRGTPLLTSGVRINGVNQVVEFNLTDDTPQQRLITSDDANKSDAFSFLFGSQQVMLTGNDSLEGAIQVYTRSEGEQLFRPVETIRPQVAGLEPPLFAQSNEHIVFDGRAYTAFQVNTRDDDFFGTTFQKGEIWLASILQEEQRQWLLSADSEASKFEPEPFVGNERVWVFYSSAPEGSELRTATIQLRRASTPLQSYRENWSVH